MTNTDQIEQPADESAEAALAEARAIWARVALRLAEIVDDDVERLVEAKRARKGAPGAEQNQPEKEKDKPKADEGALLRSICAAVIAAQRTMEIEDRYEQKVQRVSPPDATGIAREATRRILDAARSVGVDIGAEDDRPQGDAGTAARDQTEAERQ